MNQLSKKKRAQILALLVEGNSLRATSRLADCSINTVTKLLVEVGAACADYQDKTLRDLPCTRLECDEIWSFCYAKERNVPATMAGQFGIGDVWTWVAVCADTKLVPSWLVGNRDASYAEAFALDLASRLSSRVQITTDGLHLYIAAVDNAFGSNVDYAMLVKTYGQPVGGAPIPPGRYSPPVCTGSMKVPVRGAPNMGLVSTSYAERQNLTMRMSMRRFTRLTNGFSKKVENLAHAVALHFMYYNFGRVHKSLRVTPAMQAGVTGHAWTFEEIVALAR